MKYIIEDLNKMEDFAAKLAKSLKSGDVISLIGDLGAGKTTLTQYVLKHLGVEENVTSPTFALVNIYRAPGDGLNIYHLDMYRIEDPEEIEQIDFESYFYPEGISFIEWAEKVEGYLPDDMIEIRIDYEDKGRSIVIEENTGRAKEIIEDIDENTRS